MRNSQSLGRLLFTITLLVLTTVIAAGVYTQASKFQKKQNDRPRTYEPAKVTSAPEVRSAIRGLVISGVSLINEGTPEAAIAIDVTNQRDEDVMTVEFVAGKDTTSGLEKDGLLEEDNPMVIIPRHSLKTFTWNLGAIMEGEPIYLAAAIFADGKEEGDKHFLEGIKKTRLKFQQRQREEKPRTEVGNETESIHCTLRHPFQRLAFMRRVPALSIHIGQSARQNN